MAIIDAISCEKLTTASNGTLAVTLTNGLPRVLIEDSKKGSVCSNSTAGGTNAATTGGKSAAGRRGVADVVLGLGMGAVAVLGGFMML